MLEVTSALTDGNNVITVCLPQALFDYRVYLSGEAPHIYPAHGGPAQCDVGRLLGLDLLVARAGGPPRRR